MFYSLIHCQPLMTWMFGCYDYVYIVLTSDTVIEAGKQTVSVWWQIHTNNICFFVSDVIEESRILMCKSVVVLLPYVGCKKKVQRSDLLSPWKFGCNFQPFCMLSSHRVYYTDKCFVRSEESMTTCQEISL